MSDKPDWGHGPNEPVRMFTEDQIRKILKWWLSPELLDAAMKQLRDSHE